MVVVGGGPAGLAAARAASERGLRVSLFEAGGELGGQLRLLRRLPNRAESGEIVRFLVHELERLKVEIHLNQPVDENAIRRLDADGVILATGAAPASNSFTATASVRVVTVEDIAADGGELGKNVVLVDAGGHHQRLLAGAEQLLTTGRMLHVVTPTTMVGLDISPISLAGIMERLRHAGARLLPLTTVVEVRRGALLLQEAPQGRKWELAPVDALVVATALQARNQLASEFPDALLAGDCIAPRGILAAIHEGHQAGTTI